mmetsp:Transcript_106906/g.190015  ORF Transcript_106906/g.190015 Transcript_106906/m.190015 type:complete len:200 (+) Transcript_106906:70-669(+)
MQSSCALLAAILATASATVLRGKVHVAVHRRANLPEAIEEMCDSCQVGIVDPFSDEYCDDITKQCECCGQRVSARYKEICSNFMGYGGCIAGIKAAIEKKEEECKQRQAVNDYNREQQLKKLGVDVSDLHLSNASAVSDTKGPFDDECASYNDPSCEKEDLLCADDVGCNVRLQTSVAQLSPVLDWYGMYQNTPCLGGL